MGAPLAAASLSLVLSAAVLATAAVEKVRIDARAHRLEGESLRLAAAAGSRPSLAAAGQAYARALACYVPLDRGDEEAARGLAAVARELAAADDVRTATLLVERGLAALESHQILYVPHVVAREELLLLRRDLEALRPAPGGAEIAPAETP